MNLKAKDFRNIAWSDLRGNWGSAALFYFLMFLILTACSSVSALGIVGFIGPIAALILGGPLALGFCVFGITVIRVKSATISDGFSGFRDFVRAFVAYLLIGIFTVLWSLLLIVPGIIKWYSYRMTYYIMADHPELSANEARKQSMEMMRGNKWRLFCLDFSFIGWLLLCGLTLGILSFWIMPYMKTAEAAFYQSLLPAPEAPADNAAPAAPTSGN